MNSRSGVRPDPSGVQIVDYSAAFGAAFARLNEEWLQRYFRVEPIDRAILGDPEGEILSSGGFILYAVLSEEPLGTVALKHDGDGVYELTKMAVTAAAQGRGIGRQLLNAAIARFDEIQGRRLYLESHSSLVAALTLYESAGFSHTPRPKPSEYERSDVYMVYHEGSPESA